MVKKILSKCYIGIIFLFLYAPIIVLIVLSFNKSRARVVWGGFTLEWYKSLFDNSQIMTALGNTMVLALISAVVATIIGTLAAVGIDAMKKKSYSLTVGVANIPMLNADIVTGISLMLLFVRFMPLGFNTMILAHITFNIPYVIFSVLPKLKSIDVNVYEAARDLGANSFIAFFEIILPNIVSGIVAGFFMAITISLDDFVITYFTKGAGINTLSTMIYGQMKKGIKPEMYALSTIMFAAVLVILLLSNYFSNYQTRGEKK